LDDKTSHPKFVKATFQSTLVYFLKQEFCCECEQINLLYWCWLPDENKKLVDYLLGHRFSIHIPIIPGNFGLFYYENFEFIHTGM
jgi:hypothetical protein